MKNFEKIKNMSKEELENLLIEISNDPDYFNDYFCKVCTYKEECDKIGKCIHNANVVRFYLEHEEK